MKDIHGIHLPGWLPTLWAPELLNLLKSFKHKRIYLTNNDQTLLCTRVLFQILETQKKKKKEKMSPPPLEFASQITKDTPEHMKYYLHYYIYQAVKIASQGKMSGKAMEGVSDECIFEQRPV